MKDLSSPQWIKLKGILFLIIGVFAAILLWLENPTWKSAALLLVVIWCFCRFYYFVFYVIEKYVDSRYKFSGLISFARYFLSERK
jgi:membrane protein YdbS with pleckstrin-like domain